ncbi:MAG: hypothetical protein OEZ10_13105 [Gammaproteobacteria bacterium]|nr:hypothetical protein [Gammaproteobacteria bacterium]
MSIKQSAKEHFGDTGNAITYSLLLGLFLYQIYDEGMKRAIWSIVSIAFVFSGWFTVGYVFQSIRFRNIKMGFSDAFSVTYYIIFTVYWLIDRGIDKKAYVLILPIYTGLLIVAAILFSKTNAYKSIVTWEANIYKLILSKFRRKT